MMTKYTIGHVDVIPYATKKELADRSTDELRCLQQLYIARRKYKLASYISQQIILRMAKKGRYVAPVVPSHERLINV